MATLHIYQYSYGFCVDVYINQGPTSLSNLVIFKSKNEEQFLYILLHNILYKIYKTISDILQFLFTEVKMTKRDGSGDMMY